jgi:hypothetical protein
MERIGDDGTVRQRERSKELSIDVREQDGLCQRF